MPASKTMFAILVLGLVVGGSSTVMRCGLQDALCQEIVKSDTIDFSDLDTADDRVELVPNPESVQSLSLARTDISPKGMKYLLRMKSLKQLDVQSTKVTNDDVLHLTAVPLQTLNLNRTKVTDGVFVHINEMRSLSSLYIGGTNVSDAGLRTLKNHDLQELVIGMTTISDESEEVLSTLRQLELLDIGETHLSEPAFSRICKGLTRLKTLTVCGLMFKDDWTEGIPKGITYLDCSKTDIGDKGLRRLVRLPELESLDLRKTKITSQGTVALQKCNKLRSLSLSGRCIDLAAAASL